MTFISATRLHLRNPLFYPLTYWHSFFSSRQASKTTGFLDGKLLLDNYGALWTLTAWENDQNMTRYRGSGAHKKAMPLLLWMCDEASLVHWQQETDELPDWQIIRDRMEKEGRFSQLPHPSDRHRQQLIPLPKISSLVSEINIRSKTKKSSVMAY
jgi:hypothetical protein